MYSSFCPLITTFIATHSYICGSFPFSHGSCTYCMHIYSWHSTTFIRLPTPHTPPNPDDGVLLPQHNFWLLSSKADLHPVFSQLCHAFSQLGRSKPNFSMCYLTKEWTRELHTTWRPHTELLVMLCANLHTQLNGLSCQRSFKKVSGKS